MKTRASGWVVTVPCPSRLPGPTELLLSARARLCRGCTPPHAGLRPAGPQGDNTQHLLLGESSAHGPKTRLCWAQR